MKKYIPNFLTCCNLASGCVAAVLALVGNYDGALLGIVLSAVFDFLDGTAARLLDAHSPIGKDLDSLADDVSFGFAPAAVVFSWLQELQGGLLPYVAFLLAVFSALRLAKFNIDTRQKSSFIGLPVPANALFWAALAADGRALFGGLPAGCEAGVVVALVVAFSYLMVSELPMFSLKFKSLAWRDNAVPYVFLLGCAVLVGCFGVCGAAFSIVWYIVLSAALACRNRRSAARG